MLTTGGRVVAESWYTCRCFPSSSFAYLYFAFSRTSSCDRNWVVKWSACNWKVSARAEQSCVPFAFVCSSLRLLLPSSLPPFHTMTLKLLSPSRRRTSNQGALLFCCCCCFYHQKAKLLLSSGTVSLSSTLFYFQMTQTAFWLLAADIEQQQSLRQQQGRFDSVTSRAATDERWKLTTTACYFHFHFHFHIGAKQSDHMQPCTCSSIHSFIHSLTLFSCDTFHTPISFWLLCGGSGLGSSGKVNENWVRAKKQTSSWE